MTGREGAYGPATVRGLANVAAGRAVLSEGAWAALLVGAFTAYYFAPGLPLSLALLALCALLCVVQLPLAVSLVPLATPFFMLPKHLGHPTPEFSLGETAIVLCAGAFVLQRARSFLQGEWTVQDAWRLLPHPRPSGATTTPARRVAGLAVAIAVFLLAATAATLAAHYHREALRAYREVILEPIVYYGLVRATLRDEHGRLRALWSVAGAGLLVAMLGLTQYFFRPQTLTGTEWIGTTPHPLHLVEAVYGSPDNLGLLLDRAVPVAIVLLLAVLAGRARAGARARRDATLIALGILLMVAALLLSGSRGGMITALAVGFLVILLWRGRRRRDGRRDWPLLLAGLAVVAAGAAAVLVTVQHGLSTVARLYVWRSALAMIHDHPLLGVGPDNFLYYYIAPRFRQTTSCIPAGIVLPAKHYMLPAAWREPCYSHPHNMVLDVWLSTGLAGLLALAAIVVAFIVYAWRGLRAQGRQGPLPSRTLWVAATAIVAATLLHGAVDNSVFVPDLAVDFWLALALVSDALLTAGHHLPAPTGAAAAPAGAAPRPARPG